MLLAGDAREVVDRGLRHLQPLGRVKHAGDAVAEVRELNGD